MDDNSKENIQPIRGGRNPTLLGIAIQAQNSADYQRELIQQKQEFENAICNYTGDDPLENYYNYISWVEQSFPKHGHEGNLVPLLQDCLRKFEDDKRYTNDRRICKLWIKFIDYQQNPIELYHMLYSKGICKGCADFYRAWAFYHEVVDDYKSADMVFNCGRRELAQPYEQLVAAHQSMIFAAGQQVINGIDQERLQEQRNALTTLRTYKAGRVGSVRHSTFNAGTTVPGRSSIPPNGNRIFNVYEEENDQPLGAAAAPASVLEIARRDVGTKENLMKPGIWTNVTVGRVQPEHRTSSFSVHEDCYDIHRRGLQLPPNFASATHETYTDIFVPSLVMMEPDDPQKIAKYPKKLVYFEEQVEYSIEEIKARWLSRPEQAADEIQIEKVSTTTLELTNTNLDMHTSIADIMLHTGKEMNIPEVVQLENATTAILHLPADYEDMPTLLPNSMAAPLLEVMHTEYEIPTLHLECDVMNDYAGRPDNITVFCDASDAQHNSLNIVDLWASRDNLESEIPEREISTRKNMTKFEIFDDSNVREQQVQLKGSAMKTPLKTLSADDLVETGSRGGLDIAMAAQPVDSARNVINLDDQNIYPVSEPQDFETTNTQMFNFNLNAMKVSTPQTKQQGIQRGVNADGSKKQLFGDHTKALSTIYEETKSYASSGSSGSSGLKSTLLNSKKLFSQEQSTYHINLAQNLKANAALRSSLLGEFIDCVPENPIYEVSKESQPSVPPVMIPTMITPLMSAPDDPFKASLIETLLERINFPGQHVYGYIKIYDVPRLNVKKEIVDIGREKYYVEKLIGKGAFGSVYKAEDCQTRQIVAIKCQRPPNKWEYYICRELQVRLADNHMKDRFMDIHRGYFSDQASILVSDFNVNGSLLDIANKLKQKTGRAMKESLCVHFCIEMLDIISAMHSAKIIHADIKPDNFLVQLVDNNVKLHLIDFGCSIDMAMFAPGTTFLRKVTTEDFTCCEMLDGRPWSYHTDLFCVAASAHVLLFDKYIQMQKKDGHWSIKQRFLRYYRVDCWNMFFSTLLNQQNGPAKIEPLKRMLSGVLDMCTTDFQSDMRFLVNMLRGR